MASSTPITWVGNINGQPACIRDYQEGTSETFKKGALVIYDVSENGVVEVTVSSGVPSAQTFIGVAMKAATGTAGSTIPVLLPTSGDLFKASLASDQATLVAPAGDDRGKKYGLIKLDGTQGTAGHFVVDNANTTWVKVIELEGGRVTQRGKELLSDISGMTAGDEVVFQFLEGVIGASGSQA